MDDSGFEEDHVALLAELTSQALLHQPVSLDMDPISNLETLVRAAERSTNPTSSKAFLYGFLVCVQETMRFLTEVECLPVDHPIVSGMYSHLLSEYVHLSTQLCLELTAGAPDQQRNRGVPRPALGAAVVRGVNEAGAAAGDSPPPLVSSTTSPPHPSPVTPGKSVQHERQAAAS